MCALDVLLFSASIAWRLLQSASVAKRRSSSDAVAEAITDRNLASVTLHPSLLGGVCYARLHGGLLELLGDLCDRKLAGRIEQRLRHRPVVAAVAGRSPSDRLHRVAAHAEGWWFSKQELREDNLVVRGESDISCRNNSGEICLGTCLGVANSVFDRGLHALPEDHIPQCPPAPLADALVHELVPTLVRVEHLQVVRPEDVVQRALDVVVLAEASCGAPFAKTCSDMTGERIGKL